MPVTNVSSLVNKPVKLTLAEENTEIIGLTYTIDPVTGNFVLLQKLNEGMRLKIVCKHAIKNIEEISNDELSNVNTKNLFANACQRQIITKHNLMEWLKRNQFPFVEDGENLIVEGVTINPPYNSENCFSANSIVLGRIQQMLSNLQTHLST